MATSERMGDGGPVAGGGVDVLAVLARHEALAVEVASPEQVAEAQAVYVAVAELIAERDALAARLAEDRAVLDSIRNAVGGGPYDTIARRVAELIEAATAFRDSTTLQQEREAKERLYAALSNIEGAST